MTATFATRVSLYAAKHLQQATGSRRDVAEFDRIQVPVVIDDEHVFTLLEDHAVNVAPLLCRELAQETSRVRNRPWRDG